MSLTKYCTSCGSPNLYAAAPPKFCASCGKPISHIASTQSNTPKVLFPKNGEDTEVGEELPVISQLAYKIKGSTRSQAPRLSVGPNGISVAGLGMEEGPVEIKPVSKFKGKKKSNKSILAEHLKEGGGVSRIEVGDE